MQEADRIHGNITKAGPIRIESVGHAVFALTMIGLGIIGLMQGNFTPNWSGVPRGFPARTALVYVCSIVSLVTGVGLLLRHSATIAARVLLTYLLLWMLVFRGYLIYLAPKSSLTWWAWGDTAVMMAAAWVLYAWLADNGGP